MLALASLITFTRSNWRILLPIALTLGLILGFYLWSAHERHVGAEGVKTQDRKAIAVAVAKNTEAHAKADTERASDTARTDTTRKDLSHAADHVQDTAPSAARVALGCERLRKQGGGRVVLPAVCRSGGAGQAKAGPVSPG